jgi:hypothetical protein
MTYDNAPGGIVKRSLAMALHGYDKAIAKACGLDDATQILETARNNPRHHQKQGLP